MDTYNTLEEIKAGSNDGSSGSEQWSLRPEQRDAIDRAKNRFCSRSGKKSDYVWTLRPKFQQYLWNAKMRFGKTICALQLAREMGVKRTLIVTHRPVVNQSWEDDFANVFGDKIKGNIDVKDHYAYGFNDEQDGKRNFYDLEKFVQTDGNHYVFFVSMQYLRLSELVNTKTEAKNKDKPDDMFGHSAIKENEKLKADILNADWDLVVVDEAHEGTRTALGKRVIDECLGRKEKNVKVLHLSGTPFNLYEDFEEEEIYTWDYISEQQAKREWAVNHPQKENPYAELPQMRIFTYDITKKFDTIKDQTGVFSFSEFFRVWTGNPKADRATVPTETKGRFVHEEEVLKFLQLLCTKDAENNFPFSTDDYRKMFRHTLWVVSHVNEAKALEQLLREHSVFKRFNIVNVAGSNLDDETYDDALDKVQSAIGQIPEHTSTITISCGRLTTGVTVKPWTAVLYMKGGDGAATYMQTIFRVQSPYKTPKGKMKTSCYVFDFAPDRTLKIVAETAKFSSMAKTKEAKKEDEENSTQEQRDKETMAHFIELCPVISMDGGQMRELDVETIYKQLENVFVDRLVRKGFDDPCLYNQDELNKIDKDIINTIGEHGGQAPDEKRQDAKTVVDLSHMTDEQRAAYEESIRQKKAEAARKAADKAQKDEEFKKKWESWNEEEREEWLQEEAEKVTQREELKKQREEFKKRITNIRGIALRIPLLMYGGADAGDGKEDITVDNFTRKIKDESWAEFMPKGISKEDFNKIKKCFNATRFEESGKKYRALTREADFMHVDDRIKQITEIFSFFRNPDKETVLTPWRVVNMHMSDTLGGYCWYDETFNEKTGVLDKPRFVDQGAVTHELFDHVDLMGEVQTKILEINSKTGLYPLYVTYSLYRRRLEEYVKAQCIDIDAVSVQEEQVVWDDIVTDNVFVICNTPMAVGITKRTLFGFREVEKKANIKNEQLIERTITEPESLKKELVNLGFWKGTKSNDMIKFNAVIGNPPYQIMVYKSENSISKAKSIYNIFMDLAFGLSPNYVSMITPSRWMTKTADGISDTWVDNNLNCNHFVTIHDYLDSKDCFPGVGIGGGVNYFLWSALHNGTCKYMLSSSNGTFINDNYLNVNGYNILVRDSFASRILSKISEIEGDYQNIADKNFSSLVTPNHFLDKNGHLGTKWNGYVVHRDEIHSLKYYLNKQLEKTGYAWINENELDKNAYIKDLHKVYIPKAYGSATDPNVLGKPFYGEPNSVCSQTYFIIGYDKDKHNFTKDQCESIISYIKTKFFRYIVSIKKKTQDNPRGVFQFVPIISWDKQWSNKDLYERYSLTEEEINYIENSIKPME